MRGQALTSLTFISIVFVLIVRPTNAQQCEPRWAGDLFVAPGTDDAVTSLAIWNDGTWPSVFVGGGETAQTSTINYIGKWDGIEWNELGAGVNHQVRAVCVYDNTLVVGGSFSNADGSTAYRVARWDGMHWSALGSGVNGTVYAMTVFQGHLIVGGEFNSAGGQPANNIARWDGDEWHSLEAGTDSSVYAMAVRDGQLVVGGDFLSAGEMPANRIATWSGEEWATLPGGVDNGVVRALLVRDGNLVIGGSFTSVAGLNIPYLAMWDGQEFGALGSAFDGQVYSLGTYQQSLIAGGSFKMAGELLVNHVARWNGSGWEALGSGTNGAVQSLVQFDDELMIGGAFNRAGEVVATNIARWSGSSWSALGPNRAKPPVNVWSMGQFEGDLAIFQVISIQQQIILEQEKLVLWNGENWTLPGFPYSGAVAEMIEFDGQLVVTTANQTGGDLKEAGYVVQWDGENWSTLANGVDSWVFAFSRFQSNLVAGGFFWHAGEVEVRGLAAWDGESWSGVNHGLTFARVIDIVSDDNQMYVAGYLDIGAPEYLGVGKWDGQSWEYFEGPEGEECSCRVAIYQGQLIVAGSFTTTGDMPLNRIARRDESTWQPLGEGIAGGSVNGIQVSGERLWVAGPFTSAGGQPANGVALWDGATWSPLGEGINGYARGLELIEDNLGPGPALYVGGNFRLAGGKVSLNLARWGCLYDKADFDHNMVVDLADFATFSPCLLGREATPMEACREADLFRDERVELRDFALFQRSFGDTQ